MDQNSKPNTPYFFCQVFYFWLPQICFFFIFIEAKKNLVKLNLNKFCYNKKFIKYFFKIK